MNNLDILLHNRVLREEHPDLFNQGYKFEDIAIPDNLRGYVLEMCRKNLKVKVRMVEIPWDEKASLRYFRMFTKPQGS